ncbi:polycystic kidney disease protein 1-like 3 [Synchiropus splendidus]|uniref:polycystic kidney disease protein 1-like 3 n=1 Tax=Synchiropus splendidus TaxID=270530 RepID=UPI00237E0DDE|nr:polycystic kidney disease protein 1-like 3 [Synchiropus splendidus]
MTTRRAVSIGPSTTDASSPTRGVMTSYTGFLVFSRISRSRDPGTTNSQTASLGPTNIRRSRTPRGITTSLLPTLATSQVSGSQEPHRGTSISTKGITASDSRAPASSRVSGSPVTGTTNTKAVTLGPSNTEVSRTSRGFRTSLSGLLATSGVLVSQEPTTTKPQAVTLGTSSTEASRKTSDSPALATSRVPGPQVPDPTNPLTVSHGPSNTEASRTTRRISTSLSPVLASSRVYTSHEPGTKNPQAPSLGPSNTIASVTQKSTLAKAEDTTVSKTTESSSKNHFYTCNLSFPDEPSAGVEDPNSSAHKSLKKRVLSFLHSVLGRAFLGKFLRAVITAFRPFSRSVRTTGVTADIRVEFNGSTPVSELPTNSELAETLKNSSSEAPLHNISRIDPDSIQVTAGPRPDAVTITTMSPTANVTTKATTLKATTAVQTVTKRLTFRSNSNTFTVDLLNPTTSAFQERRELIVSQLQPQFKGAFPSSFISMDVVSFSNGSIINNLDAKFIFTTAPNASQIADVLRSANVTGFDIDGSFIFIDGASASGVSHRISLVTALCFAVLSTLLSTPH